ncbi:toxin-antitoxin system YwqK family antitoxin [uncultured Porphyromonas sp.]|uniref:toxin-antitoxin system YwqK family antitoxin n=1 Tax=uncultured Porphyromonas sp. TaxID=159274 RepID=UPI00259B881B|nr:toxin-antitoxin system YwqK family antitoxin [uncultured Porphyromonas sp.]
MISKRVLKTAEGWLGKRSDLSEEKKVAFLNYIQPMDNLTALATAKWYANDMIRVPEDQTSIDESILVAKRAKVDPLTYSNPLKILNSFKQYKIKEKAIDPDTVPELSNGRTVGPSSFSIRIYDVEDTKEGQLAMRKIINTHWGEDANPWCVLQGDGEGNLSEHAWKYWNKYNGVPKKVAFKNGKLLSFCANDYAFNQWWDRQDVPYNGIRFVEKLKDDKLRRSAFYELKENGDIASRSLPFLGNMQNGEYKEWHENEQLKLRENYKNGNLDGPSEEWYDNGQLKTCGDWKKGNREGIKESFYENGQLESKINYSGGYRDCVIEEWYPNGQLKQKPKYKDGKVEGVQERWYENGQLEIRGQFHGGRYEGLFEVWHENGQLKARVTYKDGNRNGLREEWSENGTLVVRENYKDGKLEGLREEWYKNGQIKERTNYKEGEKDGLHERFYYSGSLLSRESYKEGLKDGLCESWWENEKLKTQISYKGGREEGECKTWLKNGLLKSKWNSKNGWLEGLVENWWDNGQLATRCNYKDGQLEGLRESWHENGQLMRRENYKNGLQNGLVETRNEDGSVTRSVYNNGELQQEKRAKSFIKMGNEQRTIIAPRESTIGMKA